MSGSASGSSAAPVDYAALELKLKKSLVDLSAVGGKIGLLVDTFKGTVAELVPVTVLKALRQEQQRQPKPEEPKPTPEEPKPKPEPKPAPKPEEKKEKKKEEESEGTAKEKPIEVESETEPPPKRLRREWQQEDDMASRSSWQSRAEQHQRHQQAWICYRCKEACGRDAKHCQRPLETLRTSALVDLMDRLKFRGKHDAREELPCALDLLQGRGFRVPETRQEALSLRKCLNP